VLQKRKYIIHKGAAQEAHWPAVSEWVDFNTLWQRNEPYIARSCEQFGVENNSPQETAHIRSSLINEARETGLDLVFLAAIGLQESGLCVRAPTTRYAHANPGIFQTHDGAGTCHPEGGSPISPCPPETIALMVNEGANGTRKGDGLKQLYDAATGTGAAKYYRTARAYNSGTAEVIMEAGGATHSYVADVANRVSGNVFARSGFDGGADVEMAAWRPSAPTRGGHEEEEDEEEQTGGGGNGRPSVVGGEGRAKISAVTTPPGDPGKPDCQNCGPFARPKPAVQQVTRTPQAGASKASAAVLAKIKIPLTDARLTIVADKGPAGLNYGPGVRKGCQVYVKVKKEQTCNEVAALFSTTYEAMRVDNTLLGPNCNNLWAESDACMIP
jgi:hypothetical protein